MLPKNDENCSPNLGINVHEPSNDYADPEDVNIKISNNAGSDIKFLFFLVTIKMI